jgi:hypothetical protein
MIAEAAHGIAAWNFDGNRMDLVDSISQTFILAEAASAVRQRLLIQSTKTLRGAAREHCGKSPGQRIDLEAFDSDTTCYKIAQQK